MSPFPFNGYLSCFQSPSTSENATMNNLMNTSFSVYVDNLYAFYRGQFGNICNVANVSFGPAILLGFGVYIHISIYYIIYIRYMYIYIFPYLFRYIENYEFTMIYPIQVQHF